MLSFKEILDEGGNVKLKTGETAVPIKITPENRAQVQKDTHDMLHAMHQSFNKAYGEDLFGKNAKALATGSTYSGSTKSLMDKSISDVEFTKHKKEAGDIDVKIPQEHMPTLAQHLTPGQKFGKYTYVGMKSGGGEHHAIMRHDSGEHHQIDFEKSTYQNHEPSEFDQFAHSADWGDIKLGIKGAHHKQLLNAVGTDQHKFSSLYGIGSRTNKDVPWENNFEKMTKTLFGPSADAKQLHSFQGIVQLIKKHIPKSHHQAIYDKFKNDVTKTNKHINNKPALELMKKQLGVKDVVGEDLILEKKDDVHHASVIPLTGFSPISHMGHALDLGAALKKLPGAKHIGISNKADLYSGEERKDILSKQWKQSNLQTHLVKSGGETIANAYNALPKTGEKHLNILVGHDRKDFAQGLKASLEAGKIKEMGDNRWTSITIHHPEDSDRSHGMSGTAMRTSAEKSDLEQFHKHLGPMFSSAEAKKHMEKFQTGLSSGQIKVKRPGNNPKKAIKEDLDEAKIKLTAAQKIQRAIEREREKNKPYAAAQDRERRLTAMINSHDQKKKEDEKNESILGYSQRLARGQRFKRMQKRLLRTRLAQAKRFADPKRLKGRAVKDAYKLFRARITGGKNYASLSTGEKISVDTRLQKMLPGIKKLAARLVGTERQKEMQRKQKALMKRESTMNEMFSEIFESKETSRLDQLVRMGLADSKMLTVLKRSMEKLKSGDQLSTQEKSATNDLLSTLLDMVLSSDSLFGMTKKQLQKESVDDYENEYEDSPEMDGVEMAQIELANMIEDANDLLDMLDEMDEEPDQWVLSKITKAADYIATASDYLQFEDNFEMDDEEDDDGEYSGEIDDSMLDQYTMDAPASDYGSAYEEFKPIIEEIEGLKSKSVKSGIDYSILKEVYNRGLGTWEDNHRSGTTPQQWAFARVNSFISKGKGTWGGIDSDLASKASTNEQFSKFAEALEWGTDAMRMAYARATPGQSLDIVTAKYSANSVMNTLNDITTQRKKKIFDEEKECCDDCKEVEEGLKDPEDNPCWKGYKPVGTKIKNGKTVPNCVPVEEEIAEEVDWVNILFEADYQGKSVKLNDPFRTPDGPKKFGVYTMGPNGKVVIVRFGDPNMEIKRDDPERLKSYRARHGCESPGPKWKANYWSCQMWRSDKTVGELD